MPKKKIILILFFSCLVVLPFHLFSLGPDSPTLEEQKKSSLIKEAPKVPLKVDVNPKTYDSEISKRLEDIMNATGWFDNPQIKVKNGVVFLKGTTKTDELKVWAEELARNTQDTVAVVNHIEVTKPSIWEYQPVLNGLRNQWLSLLRIIPTIIFGFIIFGTTLIISRLIMFLARFFLSKKFSNPIIQKFISWCIGLVVLLFGLYVIFNLMGLTNIALTVIGGTGLIGIILGVAFKEITENFLASIFLSINNPFQTGDLIELDGILGYVEKLTFRSTILIKLDGTYVQVPNATVYKVNIHNYTSNPNHREDFTVGIGYENQISEAQEIALKILKEHPAVLKNPEPWVLVDGLGKASVNLKVYFWMDRKKHSWLKVKSVVIRLIKDAFQLGGISMPDEDRERIFPDGLTVRIDSEKPQLSNKPSEKESSKKNNKLAADAEGHLQSEEHEIKEQALKSEAPEAGRNLLIKK